MALETLKVESYQYLGHLEGDALEVQAVKTNSKGGLYVRYRFQALINGTEYKCRYNFSVSARDNNLNQENYQHQYRRLTNATPDEINASIVTGEYNKKPFKYVSFKLKARLIQPKIIQKFDNNSHFGKIS